MSKDRRTFLKQLGLAGLGIASASTFGSGNNAPFKLSGAQSFNMRGYAAPPLEKVRIGIIGIGKRGMDALDRLPRIEGVEIKAVCDLREKQTDKAVQLLNKFGHEPDTYYGSENIWKKLCEREDIDLVYICTPWHLHTPQCVFSMEHDKHVAIEVPAAQTIEECWELVETSERTKKHCMMLENVCYDFFEMLTLKMAREGFFGDLIHGEGAYIHDRLDRIFEKGETTWRLKENIERDGNLYPTHGLGPIAEVMDINCGDQMDFLVSMSSNDFSMGPLAKKKAGEDKSWKKYAESNFRGNMNTTIIKTKLGRTIMIQHDTTTPRPYSRIHLVCGNEAITRKWPLPARIANSHEGWVSEEEFNTIEDKYTPQITKKVGKMAKKVGGHGGMDTIMDWRLIDCLRNGLPLDMDVYDAALWSAIVPLSEWSVANRFNSVQVPDFTSGAWKKNPRGMDVGLNRGGSTEILRM